MPAKIRLSRYGRKQRPYYHIVVADGRAPRDGKPIERIGFYNPCTNPATIELDFDKALTWLQNGAQPTETARAILRYEGVLMKKHLLDGVKKGAFDEATAESRFDNWKREKLAKIQSKVDRLSKAEADDINKRLAAEAKINEARAQAIAKKNSKLAADLAEEEEDDDAVEEETVSEAVKAPVAETVAEPVAVAVEPKEEAKEEVEAPAAEAAGEPAVEEAKE